MRRTKFPPSVRLKGRQGWYIAVEVLPGKFIRESKKLKGKRKDFLKLIPPINRSLIKITKDFKIIERYKFRYNGWEIKGKQVELLNLFK